MPNTPQYAFPYPAPTDQPDGAAQIQALAQRIEAVLAGQAVVPSGIISPFGGPAAPAGWLLCDGAAISRTTYAALFAILGTRYGAGDGSTTFNTPNLRGRTTVGFDAGQTEFDTIGKYAGAKTHTLTIAEMPAHDHGGVTGSGTTAGGVTGAGATGASATGAADRSLATSAQSAGDHFHYLPNWDGIAIAGGATAQLGSGQTSRYLVQGFTTQTQNSGAHAHSVAGVDHLHGIPALSVPPLSIPGLAVPQLTISGQGASTPIPMLPPYVVVNHIIKT